MIDAELKEILVVNLPSKPQGVINLFKSTTVTAGTSSTILEWTVPLAVARGVIKKYGFNITAGDPANVTITIYFNGMQFPQQQFDYNSSLGTTINALFDTHQEIKAYDIVKVVVDNTTGAIDCVPWVALTGWYYSF